ncbi:MAG: universal stress protein [Verrucomicrobia bacterium]|nr:universal stress protein [Verrucomicrobiota bacterium]
MKFKPSPRKGNLIVEMEPGNTRLLSRINGPITELKKLLVPIDFSDCSRHALKYAVAFAQQFTAEITLVAVIEENRTAFDYGNPEFAANLEERTARYQIELKKLTADYLGKIKNRILVKSGRPFEEIVRAAKELDTDMIVIATHGHTGMRHVELGSTAERVVRYANCPVLVVREKEHEFVPPVV